MGYNGLAKELRKRWGKGRKSEADDVARDAQSERMDAVDKTDRTQDWKESAQDQISALLDDVSDDAEDDELDLAAIRQALVDKNAAYTSEEPTAEGGDDLFLVIDEILAPDTPEADVPKTRPPSSKKSQGSAKKEIDDISPLSPTAVVMEPVLKDVVVAELLSQGVVTLPQALMAVRRQDVNAESNLWRILAELPNIDRRRIFKTAADLLGYESIVVNEAFSVKDVVGVLDQVPALLRRRLFAFNLLPYKVKGGTAASSGWIMITHDPANPDLQAVVKRLNVAVDLYYAPEDVVAHYLKQLQKLSEAGDAAPAESVAIDLDLTANVEDGAPAEVEAVDACDDETQEAEVIGSDEDDDFLELHWEPLEETDDEEPPVVTPRTRADRPALEWKTLADLTDEAERTLEPEQDSADDFEAYEETTSLDMSSDADASSDFSFELTSEELDRLENTDALPIDDLILDETIASELLDEFTDNAFSDPQDEPPKNGAPSFDGISIDFPDHAPVPDVSDWTQQQEQEDAFALSFEPDEDDESAETFEPEAEESPSSFSFALPDESVQPGQMRPPEEPSQPAEPVRRAEQSAPEPEADEMDDDQGAELSAEELKKIRAKDRVVGMLLRKKAVSGKHIRQALKKQKEEKLKEPLWRILTLLDTVDRNVIFAEAASVYAFKTAEIQGNKADPEFARSVMNTFEEQLRDSLLKLRVVPLEVDLDPQTGAIKVVFITHDPTRPEVHRVMQKLKLERFELRYATESIVTGLIYEAFPRKNEFLERLDEHEAFDLGTSYNDESNELIDEDALEAEINRSKLINLFEATLVEAVRQDASDVHIWPNARKQVEIHFRIDGRLRRWHVEDKVHPEAFIAVIKDNSMNVDRFERDAAQDGFIQRWIDEALIRFRVSVLPIANAAQDVRSESIVIRVLDDRKVVKDLAKLGLNELALRRFRKAISQPHGMVILTGPTGSGKTTTLYASLHEVINPEVNVLTVEDPVEYILPGVRQIKLNNKLGLDGALRSILRHDPDVVMVGEMRDKPTAELAIKLANTGHLTFSTLHTNDAASAVTRLYKMGIEPFLIAYAINLVVAQRLIRRLCPTCKVVDPDPDHVLMRKLGFTQEEIDTTTVYAQGEDDNCPTCKGVHFKGRRAVSEAMYFSREVRHLIADSEQLDELQIKDLAVEQGMMTLTDSAREVVKQGDTSILEMMRVVSTEE